MHSFKAAVPQSTSLSNSDVYCNYSQSSIYLRGEEGGRNVPRLVDLGELELSAANVFHYDAAVNLSTSSTYNEMKANNVSFVSNNFQFGEFNNNLGSTEMVSSGTGQFMLQKGTMAGFGSGAVGNGHFWNWTDTSTDSEEKNQYAGVYHGRSIVADSMNQSMGKMEDQKVLRRLAQNREAAKKSRMRKKSYVQQLENSRKRLMQLEQELRRARHKEVNKTQGIFASSGDHNHSFGGNGALTFDINYALWLEEHQLLINDLRSALNSHLGDTELRILLDGVMSHYDEIFRLKSIATKSDVFHMLSGMWKTPAERCFMWLGGIRSSDVLKILGNQIEPLTEQLLVGIYSLQQSLEQAEDALSQGLEALQQSFVETLSFHSPDSANVAGYMGQMAIAMSKLATLENYVHQADLLRQQTLQQLQRILTTRQAAQALLSISDYKSRLRALSSLWLARPKERCSPSISSCLNPQWTNASGHLHLHLPFVNV